MPWNVILPLILVALIIYVAVELTRRARRALALAREAAGFRASALAMSTRIDAILARLAERTDAVRRGTLPPGELTDELAAAAASLDEAAEAARGMPAPPGAGAVREALADDMARGARAVEMILHGCQLAAEGRGRSTELEAQTNVKRGYLNLLHAREALADHAAAAARTEPVRPPLRRVSGT